MSSANITVDYRHYIYAGSNRTPVAVYSRTGTTSGQNKVRYLLDDPQDSVVSILDSTGAVVVNESYTAYGNRRNPDTWSGAPTNAQKTAIANVTRQGYTWQTALGDMGLNHMNGRVQDAVTGTFLSADLVISDPDDPQNYNLYSYVLNNPMSFTDPSGYCPGGWGKFVSDAAIGLGDGAYKAITFGQGDLQDVRNLLGIEGGVNKNSAAYKIGHFAGEVDGAGALGGAFATKAFSRGGWLNSNRYLRIGVGKKGGDKVFRISGKWVKTESGHIDPIKLGKWP